ncbi:hypothetical protein [Gemmata sp.]|uniref:hypothetical protein n=1 Tax=Gemmata sp. TaxID=1914242 RepID=UPI003F70F954
MTTCSGCVRANSVSRLARRFWNGFSHGRSPARTTILLNVVRQFALVSRVRVTT